MITQCQQTVTDKGSLPRMAPSTWCRRRGNRRIMPDLMVTVTSAIHQSCGGRDSNPSCHAAIDISLLRCQPSCHR
jgi:hypothetical protein